MAALNLQVPTAGGVAETFSAAAAGGDSFPLQDGIVLKVKLTAAGGSRTITVVGQNPCNFGVIHNAVVLVSTDNAVTMIFIPGHAQFRDANGRVQITYSSVTGVSVAAIPA